MRTANYTELRNNLKGYIDSITETEYIMSSPQTMEDIRKGEIDLKHGKGIEVDIDAL
jgi:antitoxin YefM